MKIIVTDKELDKIYHFTSGLNSKDANKIFNSLFTSEHIEIIHQTVNQRLLELEVDEDIALIFLDTFVKNASIISILFNSNKVTLLCNVKSVLDKVSIDIRNAVDIANKIWKHKKSLNTK